MLQTSSPGSSKLAQRLIGPWSKAPKAARSEYEQYIKAIAGCLGDEISSAELHERAAAVWDALQHAPPPDKLQQGRTSLSGAVKPYRQACATLLPVHAECLASAVVLNPTTLLNTCRDSVEKILGSSDDKSIVGILGRINSLRVSPDHI